MNHIATIADHFGATNYIKIDALLCEWQHFNFIAQDTKTECLMTITPQLGITSTERFLTKLYSISSFKVMFPNLVKLSAVPQSLPATNAWP